MHRYLLHNRTIRDTSEPLLAPGQVGFLNGWGVFSTLYVSDGVLFAYERHYLRMQRDAARLRVPFEFSPEELEELLLRVVEANQAFNATLRVSIVRNHGNPFAAPHITRSTDLIAFTTGLTQWGSGVRLSYVPQGRYGASPFAGIKSCSWSQNLTWYEEAHEKGFDEVILLNEHGQISECTSANIFAIHSDRIWTPPLSSSGCLPGVTRAILLEEIRLAGLSIGERELTPDDLAESDGVFITSSTRDLVPVFEIDGAALKQAPAVVAALRQAFSKYREHYKALRARSKESLPV